ncbi:MAG: ROK family protein [Arcanobacterium sp.]|nr:ROK family protein [Arcanobacterium sp.]
MSNSEKLSHGASRRVQRRVNLLNTYSQLSTEPQTISEIASSIAVSRPAVEAIIADLDSLGWISQLPPDNAFGRPATRWALNPSVIHVLGLDIGAHHCTAVVADLAGTVHGENTQSLQQDLPATDRLAAATAVGKTVLKQAQLTYDDITLICVASPGAIDAGTVTYFGGNGMPGWEGTNITNGIASLTGCATLAAGDCALGALGESWLGAAAGHADVVYLLSGQRTGAAAIIDGHVHHGHLGSAGLIGELNPLHWKDIESSEFSRGAYGQPNPDRERIFLDAKNGDAIAQQAVETFADYLSLGAAAMVLALGPSHLVIGGTYSAYSELFLDRFTAQLSRWCPVMPEVSVSALGRHAISLGAVRYGLDSLTQSLNAFVRSSDIFPSVEGFRALYRPHSHK